MYDLATADYATAIAAGTSFSLAISNGNVWSWGFNTSAQCGDGTITSPRPHPVIQNHRSAVLCLTISAPATSRDHTGRWCEIPMERLQSRPARLTTIGTAKAYGIRIRWLSRRGW